MVDLAKLVKMCITYALCLFYSAQVLLGIVVLFFTKSHLRFWVVKKRPIPPKCLQDPAFGEHKYIHVNVSGLPAYIFCTTTKTVWAVLNLKAQTSIDWKQQTH
jgi:hypothetical protein